MLYTVTVDKYKVSCIFAICVNEGSPAMSDMAIRRSVENGNIWASCNANIFAQVEDIETGEADLHTVFDITTYHGTSKEEFIRSEWPKSLIKSVMGSLMPSKKSSTIREEAIERLVTEVAESDPYASVLSVMTFKNGEAVYRNEDWALHNPNGPAIILSGEKVWYVQGQCLYKDDFDSIQMIRQLNAAELFTTTELIEIMARS